MSIIVVSDTHLGYEQSRHIVFENFLDSLINYEGLTDLVTLGDFVDMWRRDVSKDQVLNSSQYMLEKYAR